jgi:hypothetical protein
MGWVRLIKRVVDIDVEHSPNCAGALKIIAAIEDPPVTVKIRFRHDRRIFSTFRRCLPAVTRTRTKPMAFPIRNTRARQSSVTCSTPVIA